MVALNKAQLRWIAYAGLYFFWGTTFLGIRIAVQNGLPPFFLSALRHGTAGLLLLALARWMGAPWPSRSQAKGALLLGLLFLGVSNGICAWAMQYIESAYATLVISGVPLTAFAYSVLVQGQRVRKRELALLLLGMAGVGILLSPQGSAGHVSSAWSLVALVVATLVWSVTMVEKKRFDQPADPFMLTALQMLGGGALLAVVSVVKEQPWALDLGAIHLQGWLAWLYLVIFGSCVGYASFSYLLSIDTPQRVGTYAYVNPLVAVVCGYFVLGEQISGAVIISSVLIVASVAGLLYLKENG